MKNQKHYAAAITAFSVWGFFPIALRALSEYTSGQILYFRVLFAFFLLVAVLVWKRNAVKRDIGVFRKLGARDQRRTAFFTLVGGALLIINWLGFIYVVNHVNIKTASFSYLICPVVTAVLGVVMLKEKMSSQQWIAVVLCALSCVLIGLNSGSELGFSFFIATTYALYLISQRKNTGFDRMLVLAIQVLVALTILTIFNDSFVNAVPTASKFYLIILLIAFLFTVFPLFLNLYALSGLSSATIGILMYLNPLINFTIAFLIFHESASVLQGIGYALIFVALIIFNWSWISRLRESVPARA